MDNIRSAVSDFWTKEVRTDHFVALAAGKEIGHKIGDMVDEKTTELLTGLDEFQIAHQLKKDGSRASRSMGDLWVKGGGIYNPINVKGGEFGKKGRPNLVSLKKVLSALADGVIDSYYLLIMKIEHNGDYLVPNVYLVDMLDFLDYTAFDSGPGQTMLKERQFYPAVDALYEKGLYRREPRLSVSDKIDKLLEMLRKADLALTIERDKKRRKIELQVEKYSERTEAGADEKIDAKEQRKKFNLG
jgi:hypothetical protein